MTRVEHRIIYLPIVDPSDTETTQYQSEQPSGNSEVPVKCLVFILLLDALFTWTKSYKNIQSTSGEHEKLIRVRASPFSTF